MNPGVGKRCHQPSQRVIKHRRHQLPVGCKTPGTSQCHGEAHRRRRQSAIATGRSVARPPQCRPGRKIDQRGIERNRPLRPDHRVGTITRNGEIHAVPAPRQICVPPTVARMAKIERKRAGFGVPPIWADHDRDASDQMAEKGSFGRPDIQRTTDHRREDHHALRRRRPECRLDPMLGRRPARRRHAGAQKADEGPDEDQPHLPILANRTSPAMGLPSTAIAERTSQPSRTP